MSDEDRDEPGAPGGSEPEKPRLDVWIAPFFQDSLLWPVTFTVATVFALFMATILIFAFRERNLPAMGALLGLVWLSMEPVRGAWQRRHFGPSVGAVLLLWGLAVGIAALGSWTGFL